ncbi:MAG: DCC1-like thiol-disulfide oxidoreductase family protein [Pirellulales bacterium]
MTTEVTQRHMILAYDGDCPMCIATVAWLQRAGLVTPEQAVSNHELSPDDLAAAQAAGIRNQLVVLDPNTRATRTGADGLLWLVGENRGNPRWVRCFSLPVMRQLVRIVYEAVSYNRRILSPPRHQIRCECEPQATIARRLTLVGPLAALSALFVALCGAAVFHGQGYDARLGAVLALSATGAGWIVLAAAALLMLRGEQRIDYLAHLVVTAFAGALVLLPAGIAAWWLPPLVSSALAGVSLLVACAILFRMQRRRIAAVGVSPHWLWAWAGTVAAGFVGASLLGIGLGLLN